MRWVTNDHRQMEAVQPANRQPDFTRHTKRRLRGKSQVTSIVTHQTVFKDPLEKQEDSTLTWILSKDKKQIPDMSTIHQSSVVPFNLRQDHLEPPTCLHIKALIISRRTYDSGQTILDKDSADFVLLLLLSLSVPSIKIPTRTFRNPNFPKSDSKDRTTMTKVWQGTDRLAPLAPDKLTPLQSRNQDQEDTTIRIRLLLVLDVFHSRRFQARRESPNLERGPSRSLEPMKIIQSTWSLAAWST